MRANPGLLFSAFGLILLEALYSSYWGLFDILARLGVLPIGDFGREAAALLTSLTLWEECVFACALVSVWATLFLIGTRPAWSLWTYGVAVLASKLDWALMAMRDGGDVFAIDGYVSLAYQTVVLLILIALAFPRARRA